MSAPPQFSVVTPSFRNSDWLRLCIPSVADQNVSLEHIVQDSCSDDRTRDWLPGDRRVKAIVEKDNGMYDAINRGLRRASGQILAYLNCDEQYLPGALGKVQTFFENNSGVEIVFGDALVVNPAGEYICHRQASLPTKYHSWVSGNLAILTCATFFRRSLIEQRGLYFDPASRAIGDVRWVMRLIEQKVPMGLLGEVTSTFTDTGANLCLQPSARREQDELLARAPFWARRGRLFIILQYRLRRLLAGHYSPRPMHYAIYTKDSPSERKQFSVARPTFRWRRVTAPSSSIDVSFSKA